jgi:hypothetical protein
MEAAGAAIPLENPKSAGLAARLRQTRQSGRHHLEHSYDISCILDAGGSQYG